MSTAQAPQRTKCEIFTRVMGYYRPVSQFNIGKKAEFYSRTYFDPITTDAMLDAMTDAGEKCVTPANTASTNTASMTGKANTTNAVNSRASTANAVFNRTYQCAGKSEESKS